MNEFRRLGESPREHRKRVRPLLAGRQFVEVVLGCPLGHDAARVSVPTDSRFGAFEDAWEDASQTHDDALRTDVTTAPDGHRTIVVPCSVCMRPVQITEIRLKALLRKMWMPTRWESQRWDTAS